MYFFLYAILISAIFIFSGIGLTILVTPRNFGKYSLYFSPFVGLSYLSYCSWFLVKYSSWGTNDYAMFLLIPPLFFLISAYYFKKSQVREILWPFKKVNLPILIICLIIFMGISSPYIEKNISLNNVMTLGNNDIAEYATISKYLLNPVNFSSSDLVFQHFNNMITNTYFGAFISTAIPCSMLNIEPYKLQNPVGYLFYIFCIPIIYLISRKIFQYNKYIALIVTSISGISFHLLYILYHGFLGQVIGMGFFLSLFFIIFYLIHKNTNRNELLSYLPLITVLFYGLTSTYITLFPLFFGSLIFYLILCILFFKPRRHYLNCTVFLGVSIFLTFIISPFQFVNRMNVLTKFTTISAGWNLPTITPDWLFGVFLYPSISDRLFFGVNGTPFIERMIISIPIILLVLSSIVYLYKNDKKLFLLVLSYFVFIFSFYCYFEFKELSSPMFTGEGYKAYKLITYFIPIIILSGLCYFRNFKIGSINEISRSKFFGGAILLILLCANIFSAGLIIEANYRLSSTINDNIIDLQNNSEFENVTSVNVLEPPWWNQMWIYYFLFDKHIVYLKYSAYFPASPQVGQWTLKSTTNQDILSVSNLSDSSVKIIINSDYYLEKNNSLNISLNKGWYGLESDQNSRWRWSGVNNETPSIILTNNGNDQYINMKINASPLNPENKFFVVLDSKTIMDCPNNYCEINMLYLTGGEHILAFEPKIPPQPTGTNDSRYLGYLFSNIRISGSNYVRTV